MEKTFLNRGGAALDLSDDEVHSLFSSALERARAELGRPASALLIPPDVTRFHSRAGLLTDIAFGELSRAGIAVTVLPALAERCG